MGATIYDVANYFLHRAYFDDGSSITPLKLQKLTYYAKAWSLIWDNDPLFDDEFEAWAHGPANPNLYQEYKKYGWQSIEPIEEFDSSMFTKEQIETLDVIWDEYGIYDGKYLEKLTHQETPWKNARGGCAEGDYCSTLITHDDIVEYYGAFDNE